MKNQHPPKPIDQRLSHLSLLRILPLVVLLALPAAAQAQFNYVTNNGTVTITGYTGPGGVVTIPDMINGLPVTSIGQAAFIRTSLTAVTIPNGVISIGGWAFEQCASLASVVIPASVTSIGDGAFIWCTSLTAITIPNGVTNVAVGAFSNCSSLTNVTIPSSVISIEYQAFAYCDSLTSITIPNSVMNIGQGAFESCPSLTSITIPNSVTNIEYGALMDCGSLSMITVDALNPAYSSLDGVLFNKDNTTLMQYPGGRRGTYIVPSSVTTIGAGAFAYCTNLTNAAIGKSVTNIQYYAFYDCMGLTSMTIPDSVTRIEFWAFSYCTGLTGVTCGNGVIGDGTFSYCTSLVSATIGKGVTSIGEGAFANCEDLTAMYFQGNAPSLGGALVFDGDKNLIIYYMLGTTGWGPTFGGHPTALFDLQYTTTNGAITVTGYSGPGGSLSIPSTINGLPVTSIGASAFKDSTNLTSVVIPNTVTNLGDYAFFNCIGLTGLYFNGSAPTVGSTVFDTNSQATVYYLPGLTGWGPTFGGRPTALWALPSPVILGLGTSAELQTNGFSFLISWATNTPVAIQVCANLASATWLTIQTNTLTEGFTYFNDRHWTNFPIRFYRVASAAEPIVYSSNVVGYVTKSVIGGGTNGLLQMIANPLNTTNNTIGFLIPSAPDGTVLYKFDGGIFAIATYFLGAWDHPEYTLNPGEGAIVCSPTNWSNTFVGEVLQGALSNPYPAGFSIRASQVPQAGTLTALGWPNLQVSFGDTVFRFSTTNQSYDFGVWVGAWSPDLTIAVGESIWLEVQSAGSWNRYFSVY